MSRFKWLQKCICTVVACFAVMLLSVTSAHALTIAVNDLGDTTADDGLCTLREAVEAFNTQTESGSTAGDCGAGATFNAINDTVDLTGLSGTITLTGGLIDITGGSLTPSISIIGPGADTLTIDGNANDRVFDADAACTPCDFNVLISGLTITNGSAAADGGAIYINDSDTNLTLENMVITGNTATGDGGGIYNDAGKLTISNSTISGNTSVYGGGVRNSSGVVTITNSTFSNNTVTNDGGGISSGGGGMTITNSTISGNMTGPDATDEGGGICNDFGSSLTISESTISGNTATAQGGGIRIDDDNSTATITNCTISGNAGSDGGGIAMDDSDGSVVTLLNVTIVSNTATSDGGGIYNEQGALDDNTFHVANSIIAGNTAAALGPDCLTGPIVGADGPVITAGNNFIGDDTDCDNGNFADGVLNDQVGTTGSPINPQLAALADNSTATHAPMDGSPVIDGVDNSIVMPPALDQRGVARSQVATDTTDIGAVEVACGDGTIQGTEECDDGKNNSDSTADACRTDCTNATCGDGVIDTGEACDDGNNTDGDGCDSSCALEVAPGCGNGVVESGEQCDDGNTTAGDGCSSTCQTEVTAAVCGNGILEGSEECDDGNTTAGDGCSDTCTQEDGEGGGCSISAMANTSATSGLMLLGAAITLLGIRRRRS